MKQNKKPISKRINYEVEKRVYLKTKKILSMLKNTLMRMQKEYGYKPLIIFYNKNDKKTPYFNKEMNCRF
jgi:hypothetical protein